MYSIVSEDNKENNRAKHVNKSVYLKVKMIKMMIK